MTIPIAVGVWLYLTFRHVDTYPFQATQYILKGAALPLLLASAALAQVMA